jgi:hypothetical protein
LEIHLVVVVLQQALLVDPRVLMVMMKISFIRVRRTLCLMLILLVTFGSFSTMVTDQWADQNPGGSFCLKGNHL